MADVMTALTGKMTGGERTEDDLSNHTRTLADYRRMFDDYRTNTETNRTEALIDYDYYDGKQLTAAEKTKLEERGQPDIVVNRIRVAVNGIIGVMIRSSTDPKALPVTPNDDGASSVVTDCLRYAVRKDGFRTTRRECAKDYLLGGTTAVLVGVDKDRDVTIGQIRWEEFFVDPRSRRPDCKDARYMGIARWMYVDEVGDMYPRYKSALQDAVDSGFPGMVDESYEDRPINQGWIDRLQKRVMIIEMYHRYRGQWYRCVFYYGGVLSEGLSPYKDSKGRPINPIIAVSCYVDRDNRRYGAIRDMRDLQDEINKRRSKLLHLINSSQIQARDPSAIEVDADSARKEAARPDGVIPYGWEKVKTSDMAQGQMLLLTEAKNEMERFGPNPAVLGRQGADTSGRALLARQQAGMIELAIVLDQLEEWEERVYEGIWQRQKQYWNAPKFIRVTDDPDAPQFLGINQPTPMLDANDQPLVGPDGQPAMQTENKLAEMDVDIVIDVVPETATIMEEQLRTIIEVIGGNPIYAQQVPFEVILELMPLARKNQLIKKLKEFREAAQKAGEEEKAKQLQIAAEQAVAKIEQTRADATLKAAQTQNQLAQAEENRADATSRLLKAEGDTHQRVIETISAAEEPAAGEQTGETGA